VSDGNQIYAARSQSKNRVVSGNFCLIRQQKAGAFWGAG